MVESTQDGCGCDLSPSRRLAYRPGIAFGKAFRDLLPDALMRSGAVVVFDVSLHNAVQLVAMENEHVVQALSSQTANEALAE